MRREIFDGIFSRFGAKLERDRRTGGHTGRSCYTNIALFIASRCDVRTRTGNVWCLWYGRTEVNFIEAAAVGASNSVALVANIAANVIAFIAVIQFLNATLTWFGDRVGIQKLTCEVLQWPTTVRSVFTAWCYAERGIATANRLSVRLFVRDVEVLWWMLEFFENNFRVS